MRVKTAAAALFFCAAAMGAEQPCSGDFRSPASWLENFHHAEIPQAPAVPTARPLAGRVEDLIEESAFASRQARRADNFYAAAEGARESRASAALLAALTERPAAPLVLLALKDGTIRAASSWTVEGNRLRFVTTDGRTMEAALDSLDRALTEQLNRERNVEVRLP